MAAEDNPEGQLVIGEKFVSVNSYTLGERGGSYGPVMYQLQEIWMMRGRQAAAREATRHVSRTLRWPALTHSRLWPGGGGGAAPQPQPARRADQQRDAVDRAWRRAVPRAGSAEAWRRLLLLVFAELRSVRKTHPPSQSSWHSAWTFSDPVYSWQMGREVNGLDAPWDERWSEGFAPWDAAKVVCLFPGVFDQRSAAVAVGGGNSTVSLQHFVNYVRGATGLAGLAPTADAV